MAKCIRHGKLCGHRRPGGKFSMCNYLLDTGQQRCCPEGAKCKHFTTEKQKEAVV